MAIWQDLVTDYGFAGVYNTVKRFVQKLRGVRQPESNAIMITAPGEEAEVDYGTSPNGARSAKWKVSSHPFVCYNARLQSQIGSAPDIPIELAHLGRIARNGI